MNHTDQLSALYRRHRDMSIRYEQAKRAAVRRADPETGGCPTMAHNWGNAASRAAVRHFEARSRIYHDLYDAAYAATLHAAHIAEGRGGAYLWCDACRQRGKFACVEG